MDKKKEFRKSMAVIGTAIAVAIGGGKLTAEANKSEDLSQYAVRDNKYVDYIEGSEYEKFNAMTELDANIKKYEELSSKTSLSKEQKEELLETKKSIKDEMVSGGLADFYLNDLLKEKLKQTYDAYSVKTNYSNDAKIRIDLYEKNGRYETMKDEDEIAPIKIAMSDIATLQGYVGADQDKLLNSDINKFIKIQKNMKGFSNLKFIKSEGKPLAYAQIDVEKDNDREF